MGNIGMTEIAVILAVAILIFGAKRLPEMGKSFGKALREFKRAISGEDSSDSDDKKKES